MNIHIQIRLKSVYHILGRVVILGFIKSEKNLADLFTKILSRSVILESSRAIELSPE